MVELGMQDNQADQDVNFWNGYKSKVEDRIIREAEHSLVDSGAVPPPADPFQTFAESPDGQAVQAKVAAFQGAFQKEPAQGPVQAQEPQAQPQGQTQAALSSPALPASPYAAMVTKAAQANGIPENIAHGLVKQESAWDHGVVSPKGAVGLAQLMPETAKTMGVDPADPEQNVNGGMKYLSQLYQQFGSWDKALAAYKMGPNNPELQAGVIPTKAQQYVSNIMGGDQMAAQAQQSAAPANLASVAHLPGHHLEKLDQTFASRLAGMASEFEQMTGRKLTISDGHRTTEQQADVYRRKPNLAAPPGRSMHEYGHAVDIDPKDAEILISSGLGAKYGLDYLKGKTKTEKWHWQLADSYGNQAAIRAGQWSPDTAAGMQAAGYSAPGQAQPPALRTTPARTPMEQADAATVNIFTESWQRTKDYGSKALGNTYAGMGGFFRTLDDLSTDIATATGTDKGGVFKALMEESDKWAAHFNGQVKYNDYMTNVVGGILGSAPGIMEFSMGPAFAGLKGYAEGGLTTAAKSAATWGIMKGILAATNALPLALRAPTTGAAFTGQAVADGVTDPGQLAEAFGVGAGMGLMTPQTRTPWNERLPGVDYAAMTDENILNLHRAVTNGETDLATYEIGKRLLKDIPDLSERVKVEVVPALMVASKELSSQYGISGEGKIVGIHTPNVEVEPGVFRDMVKLYDGHMPAVDILHEVGGHNIVERLLPQFPDIKQELEGAWRSSGAEARGVDFYEFTADEVARSYLHQGLFMGRGDGSAWGSFVGQVKGVFDRTLDRVGLLPESRAPKDFDQLVQQSLQEGRTFKGLGAPGPKEQAQVTYQGSPTRGIDRMSDEYLGTGEGRRSETNNDYSGAYGHGHYSAQNKETGEWYRKSLSKGEPVLIDGERFEKTNEGWVHEKSGLILESNSPEAIALDYYRNEQGKDGLRERLNEIKDDGYSFKGEAEATRQAMKLYDSIEEGKPGQLYKLEVPDSDKLLDWDKPFSKQPEAVQRILLNSDVIINDDAKVFRDNFDSESKLMDFARGDKQLFDESGNLKSKFVARQDDSGGWNIFELPPGRDIYEDLARKLGSTKAASQYLDSIGIPGHQYLDGSSRSLGEGSRNVVTYSDKNVDITGTFYRVRPVAESRNWEEIGKWGFGDEATPFEIHDKLQSIEPDVIDNNLPPPLKAKSLGINYSKIESEADIAGLINKVETALAPDIDAARRYTRDHDTTAQAAEELGMTEADLLTRMRGEGWNAEKTYAARLIMNSSAEDLMRRAQEIKDGDNSDAALLAFRRRMEVHAALQAHVAGLRAEAGRALNQWKMMASTQFIDPQLMDKLTGEDVAKLTDQAGGRRMIEEAAAALADASKDGPIPAGRINTEVHNLRQRTFGDWLLAYRYASMLCSPKTHVANMLGNFLVSGMAIPERAIAGVLGKGFEKARDTTGLAWGWLSEGDGDVSMLEAKAMAFATVQSQADAFKLAWEAAKTGESMFGGKQKQDYQPMFGQGAPGWIGKALPKSMNKAADAIWTGLGTPGRMLGAEDEYFKFLGYRQELAARSFRQASIEGKQGSDITARAKELMDQPTEEMSKAALDFARVQTFSQDMGDTMSNLNRFRNSNLFLKLLMPFVSTPYNILQYSLDRTPIAFIKTSFRNDFQAGGAKRDLALARVALGSSIMGMAIMGAAAGLITGDGPSDPKEAAAWRHVYQPNSVKVGDTWYSYARTEPIGTLLSVAANARMIIQEWDSVGGESDLPTLFTALSLAAAKTVVSKTWMRGVSDALNAITFPESKGPRMLQGFMGSFIPALARDVVVETDPEVKAVWSWMDAMKARVPGLSDSLPPKRDIWGDPYQVHAAGEGIYLGWLSPIKIQTGDVAAIDHELLRLEWGPSIPKRTQSLQGVPIELTPLEYDRMIELSTQVIRKPGDDGVGRTMKADLERVIRTPEYKQQDDEQKKLTILREIQLYRQAAQIRLIKENPRLQALITTSLREKGSK